MLDHKILIKKITVLMQSGHSGNNCTNRTIGYLCYKSKLSDIKIAILTKKAYEVNDFYTKLLEINRQDFRIEKHGVRHASGTFFKLDSSNFKAAKQFLNEVWYECKK